MHSKLSVAVATVLGGLVAANAVAADDALDEVIVTAQRRSESIQNVPISMQAFTEKALEELHVQTFDDYIKYLPNVSSANNGPGQNEIFMRGLSAGSQPSQGSGSTAAFPNVAIYLDNQSGQLPGRNLDIYAADLNRIEVLEGPQGTLFGSGAEAGMVRYITNEPKLGKFEGSFKGGYSVTAHGDPNSNVTAVLNLPFGDKFAVRAVVYNDQRGGYIDNVPATFTRKNTDVGMHYANYPADASGHCPDGLPNNGWCVPPGSPTLNNNAIAGRAINPASYKGIRVSAKYQFNDDWDVLVSQTYQNLNTAGVFYQEPFGSDGQKLQPLQVTVFNPSYDTDKFESTAVTVNGKIGALKAVYTGGYLVRNVDQVNDYTDYARGVYADYYQCYGAHTAPSGAQLNSTCFSPSEAWRATERNEHMQHEFRLSTPDDWRLRAISGIYYEDNKLYDQTDWRYRTIPSCSATVTDGCFTPVGTAPGTTVQAPGLHPNSSFYQDDVREVKQTAFFISVDYDLIPKVLTATAGTRHFKFDNSLVGDVANSFFCFEQGSPAGGCIQGYNLDKQNLVGSESGWKSRANLTWHITSDMMVYYTFSQGFRPGGFNQNGGALHAYGTDGIRQYAVPRSYTSDKLANNEIGWKAEFLNRRLQWNGAFYKEKWENVQVALFNPGLVGNVFYNSNGQNFDLQGLETSLVYRPIGGLTLQAAASWNQSKQTNSPSLIDNNPASNNYGHPITQNCDSTGANCVAVSNVYGPPGSPTADSPPLQFSLRARYEFSLSDAMDAFVQAGASHVGHSYTQSGSNPPLVTGDPITTGRLRFEDPAYTTFDASVGLSKDQWTLTIYGENLSNSNASVFTSTDQFIVAQTPLRPRVIGASIEYKF